jgi:hypothetical protein
VGDEQEYGYPLSQADLPDPFKLELPRIRTQDQFEQAAFELLKEASMLVVWLVHAVPKKPFERNEAIRRGLLKRLGMLSKALLSDICHDSGYQQEVLTRQIVEVAANYFYLVADDGSGGRYDAFVLNTLAEEKANLAIIARQVKERGDDEPWPIEERMHRSIERVASAAGFDFDNVPGKAKIDWPKTIDRLALLGPAAYMPFRSGSNAVHAGWTALLLRDIAQVGGGFSLDNGPSPAVQPMTAAGLLTAETAVQYLKIDGTDIERQAFESRLNDVSQRIQGLEEAHEAFMQEQEP